MSCVSLHSLEFGAAGDDAPPDAVPPGPEPAHDGHTPARHAQTFGEPDFPAPFGMTQNLSKG